MPTAVTLYGLKTCDTTRAARRWLDQHGVAHTFHDVRADGLTRALVESWVKQLGWEKVLNKSSTTWRELPKSEKAAVDHMKAVALLLAHPALVKRPVLARSGEFALGFKPADYAKRFA